MLRVAGMHCKWSKASTPTLSGVSLEVGAQEMLLLVGAVGAGKTSLLLALLGELPAFSAERPGLKGGAHAREGKRRQPTRPTTAGFAKTRQR